jgi:glycosyltransferase involved in cell wall biosynthesis
MKILFYELPEPLRVGGLETYCRSLEAALRQKGIPVEREADPGAFAGQDAVAHFHGIWHPGYLKRSRQLRAAGIPYLTSPQGMLEPWTRRYKGWKKWPYFHLFEKRRTGGGAVLATADQEAGRLAEFFDPRQIHVLPLGIEAEWTPDYEAARAQLGWAPEEKVVLYLSRIHKKKGLLELSLALGQLDPALLRQARLVIVGAGDEAYLDECRQAQQPLANKLRIDWVPAQWGDKKYPYLRGADLMALPTYSENFGIVVIEATQVGTPVLTTVETPWRIMAERGYGWVTEPKVEHYRDALHEFFTAWHWDSTQREQAAAWTRETFGWNHLVDRYIALYEQILRHGIKKGDIA